MVRVYKSLWHINCIRDISVPDINVQLYLFWPLHLESSAFNIERFDCITFSICIENCFLGTIYLLLITFSWKFISICLANIFFSFKLIKNKNLERKAIVPNRNNDVVPCFYNESNNFCYFNKEAEYDRFWLMHSQELKLSVRYCRNNCGNSIFRVWNKIAMCFWLFENSWGIGSGLTTSFHWF